MKIVHKINGVDVTTSQGSMFFGIEMLIRDMVQVRAQVETITTIKERADVYMAFANHIQMMQIAADKMNGKL